MSTESHVCGHARLITYLIHSQRRSERVWLPLARLAARLAHRRGGVCHV